MGNTFPGPSRFREIIPAAKHDRNQFMIMYTASGGQDKSQYAMINIDSPQVIFAVDPVFALVNFFMSAARTDAPQETASLEPAGNTTVSPDSESTLNVNINLQDLSVVVLESDEEIDTQAIEFSIKQIALSKQVSDAICGSRTVHAERRTGCSDSERGQTWPVNVSNEPTARQSQLP
jgi:vacuolar protein sorting-associated protein 13A/C